MAGIGPQRVNNVPVNAFPTANVPSGANALPVLHRSPSPLSPRRRPPLVQPHDRIGALQHLMVSD